MSGRSLDLELSSGDVGTSRCLSADDCLSHLDGRADEQAVEAAQRHLDECRACCVMMAEAARCEASADRSPPRGLLTLAEGERVAGRYEIRRFVARGGMGEVYEAFDSILQERVALKTLVLTALDQEDAAGLLLREVRIARRVVHPNVCRILDVGFHRWLGAPGGAVPFLTMDFLDGETLAHRIARVGRVQPADSLRYLRDLTAGLGAVHRAGIIHRDFKSENVFLVRGDDGADRAVVMDFGLAWALERRADSRRSSGKSVLGTPDYMAPEQVEGRAVTPASDVYALGVVMFEMLVGRPPFSGESAAAVALSRLTRDAPRVSTLVPGLASSWDLILERCLAREPGRRFARVEDIAAAFDHGVRGGTEMRRSWRVALIGLAVAAGAALVGFAALRDKTEQRTLRATSAPVAPVGVVTTAATTAAQRPTTLNAESLFRGQVAASGVRSPPVAQVVRPARSQGRADVRRGAARAARPNEEAMALLESAEDLLSKGKIAEACAMAEKATRVSGDLSDGYRFLGGCYMRLGRPLEARASYRKYLDRAGTGPDASFVRAMVETPEK